MTSLQRSLDAPRLAAAAFTFAATLPLAQPTFADGHEQGYQMKAVSDRHHGELVLQGRYDDAISRNRTWARAIRENTDPDRVFPFALANNLCVAYTMGGWQDEAAPYCDAAVKAAKTRAEFEGVTPVKDTEHWAIALSNRGVQKALDGNDAGARDDFRQALQLEVDVPMVAENLYRLDQGFENLAQQTDID